MAAAVVAIAAVNVGNVAVLAGWRYDLPGLSGLSGWLLLARENNPSTWLASALFLVAALLALGLGAVASAGPDETQRRGWRFVAAGLAFVSLDETASLHERAIPPLTEGRGVVDAAWWVVLIPLAAVAVVVLWRFLTSLAAPVRWGLAAAAATYLTGAALIESVAQWWREREGDQDLIYYLVSTVEENLELAGVFLLLGVLLAAFQRDGGAIQVTFADHTSGQG